LEDDKGCEGEGKLRGYDEKVEIGEVGKEGLGGVCGG